MSYKKSVRWFIVVGFLALLLATPKPALALSACGGSYVAQAGETLGSIAARCGTSVDAIRQANPNLGDFINAGQTLWLPGAYQGGDVNYGDQYGGTYGGYQGGTNCDGYQNTSNCYGYQNTSNCYGYQNTSNCYGYQNTSNCYGYQNTSNCYGYQNSSNCYGSQYAGNTYAAYGATSGNTYVVQRGDTMRIIADRMGISLNLLIVANPQIRNPDLIYPGQVICLPSYGAQPAYYPGYYPAYNPRDFRDGHAYYTQRSSELYTVQHGETLKEIAQAHNTTMEALLELNPSIKKPGRIYAGLVILLR